MSEALQRTTIRVLIVDEHPVVRLGLRAILEAEPRIEIVGEAADPGRAVAMALAMQPDVVLMDLRLRGGSGTDAIRRLKASGSRARIVVFTNYSDEENVFGAVSAGADGFVLKSGDAAEIIAAVRTVHGGGRYYVPAVSCRLVEHIHRSVLTAREKEVLALLARGGRNKAIARFLGVAEETVKWHTRNILGKLGARTRTEAARKAMERGLVELH